MQNLLFQPLVTPEESARWDKLAESDYHVPTLLLMENASRAALYCLKEAYGPKDLLGPGLRVLVLSGGGNNGGDGLALARQLANRDCQVEVRTLRSPDQYSGISREHMEMARLAGVNVKQLDSASFCRDAADDAPDIIDYVPDIIIDALFGAGFRGPLRDDGLAAVRLINQFAARGAFVLSLDIPSGLSALSGRPEPEAVRANLTVSFAAAKPGLCLPWAEAYTGQLRVAEIGLPLELIRHTKSRFRLICPRPGILPKLPPQIHKAEKGKVLIIGGSPGLTGAATLSALGACRAGAGLVTVAAPAGLSGEIKSGHPEIMTRPLGRFSGESAHDWDEAMLADLFECIAGLGKKSAIVLGPGLGRSQAAAAIVESVLRLPDRPPLVLDADALFPYIVEHLRPDDVLTPHAGEMLRLLGEKPGMNFGKLLELPERSEAARLFCAHCPAVLLLKGAGTLIGRGDEALALNPFAEPNLAVGGSGDVLSGLIAALLARGLDSLSAASLGAWIHARSGSLLRRRWPAGGNLASDIALLLPEALAELY
ncbi:MAG: NAD(P)H-hydrate dehydratase [Deltaproteobacteria bacterium]|jgi:NAD(P)H-hydrate epimerase|nr:NAD(P)H-hydrate dehydratase [Deltaproteobacteria bacterium]